MTPRHYRLQLLRAITAATSVLLVIFAPLHGQDRGTPTPVVQVRRGAGLSTADSARALEQLADDLRAIVVLPEEIKAKNVGIDIRSLVSGRTIFAMNADRPLTPASTTKLVTTYTALAELGAGYQVRTVVSAQRQPQNGVVVGNLFVRGYGDPSFSVNDIDVLVAGLIRNGIQRVDGGVVGDGSFFDDKTDRFEYSGDADEVEALPPVAALSLNQGKFTLVISSSRRAGEPCNVQTVPHSAAFEIINTATVATGRGSRKRRSSDIKVALSKGANGKQVITVQGTLSPGRSVSYKYEMADPPMVIAGIITERLRRAGVQVSLEPTSGITPRRTRVLSEVGRPLMEILHLVMKNSNNYMAEYVFRMIGGAASDGGETADKAVQTIEKRMALSRIDFSRCIINDGSGLSRRNCLSATALASICQAAYHDKHIFEPLYGLMSIAGVDGTLRRRMKGTLAAKNVHGKTGTLRRAAALTGYVHTKDGELFAFGMLMNGGSLGAYRGVQDKLLERVADFSYNESNSPAAEPATAKRRR